LLFFVWVHLLPPVAICLAVLFVCSTCALIGITLICLVITWTYF
jgi:hypothetical protein